MNTDWFPKHWPWKVQASEEGGGGGGGVQWHVSLRYFLDFNSLKSPFLGFLVIQTGYWPDPFSFGWSLAKRWVIIIIPNARELPWVPEVFHVCGGNFQCWPNADTSLVVG